MAVHHEQAVLMANLALTRGSAAVTGLADAILINQSQEIGETRGWLRLWDEPATDPHPMTWMPMTHVMLMPESGMIAMPGVTTPTEAFQALDAGAAGLKLFPAEMIPPEAVKSIRSVIPSEVPLYPVGGIHPHSMAAYAAAGASGFGIGGQLFKPGMDAAAVRKAADAFMSARAALLQAI